MEDPVINLRAVVVVRCEVRDLLSEVNCKLQGRGVSRLHEYSKAHCLSLSFLGGVVVGRQPRVTLYSNYD
jgi:hypothetical protein